MDEAMRVALTAIQFNHDPHSARTSALNLRKNASQSLPLPEWQHELTQAARDSVAAYALNEVQGAAVQIKAQFERDDDRLREVEVRAVQAMQPDVRLWLRDLVDPALLVELPVIYSSAAQFLAFIQYANYYYTLLALYQQAQLSAPGNILGEVQPARVRFRPDGTTGMVALALQNVRLAGRGVGVHPVSWLWQYRASGQEPWSDIRFTEHLIYTVLDLPTKPWVQQPFVPENTQLPWSEVLEAACNWASGALTREDAARRITESVNTLGDGVFEYGCVTGGAEIYSSTPYKSFDCTAFLERLRGGHGNGRYVNCTDCATIVSTLANILGCDLWQSRMGEYVPPFGVNPVMAIGSQGWQQPCGGGAFTFHEVAWAGAPTDDGRVYDASLAVDSDSAPGLWPHVRVLPVNMRFGRAGEGQYRDHLAIAPDRARCRPRPEERWQRRVF